MSTIIKTIDKALNPPRKIAKTVGVPVLDLAIRLYMANIFFKSGMLKFKTYLNDDWGSTLFLFEEIHPLPGIPANMAAVTGTGGELILPILLALGLFTRLGAAGLIIMTAAIQFLIPADYGMQNPQHYMWMLLLAVPFVYGPSKLSFDHLIKKIIIK